MRRLLAYLWRHRGWLYVVVLVAIWLILFLVQISGGQFSSGVLGGLLAGLWALFLAWAVVLLIILLALLFLGLVALLRTLASLWSRRSARRHPAVRDLPPRCVRLPPNVLRRPDPLIYSQSYLLAQGMAVTWDNPDIHLELNGSAVPSSALVLGTQYEVVARIWNGSMEAPAVHMPVRFSNLEFGIGTERKPIGETTVDLPVNGAPGCPAYAHMTWTPDTPGHQCLQVELIWPDDLNPANNLGQENTLVQALNSPHAAVTFPVRNATQREQALRLEVDSYRIPSLPTCDPRRIAKAPELTRREQTAHRRDALARHGRGQFPVPAGWRILLEPSELRLAPGEQRSVTVDVTAPEGFVGRQALNVNAFEGVLLVGGVTLYVDGQ